MSDDLNELYFDYWTSLKTYLEDKGIPFTAAAPPAGKSRSLYPLAWSSGVKLEAGCSAKKEEIRAQIAFIGKEATSRFAAVKTKQVQIDAAIHNAVGNADLVEWIAPQPKIAQKKVGFVRIVCEESDPSDRDAWTAQHEWLRQRILALREVFKTILPDYLQ